MTKPKTTPHLKRGPKPKPPKPAKPKGRPGRPERVPLHLHPRRYEIAGVAAVFRMIGSMRTGAFFMTWYRGDNPKKDPDPKDVDRLRKLVEAYRGTTPDDLAWLNAMGAAISVTMMYAHMDIELAIEEVTRRAASVGEMGFAERVLLPPLIEIRRKKRCRK